MTMIHQGGIRVLHVGELDLTGPDETYREQDTDVETVPGASEGLSAINDRPPDCVVLECDLPDMAAVEFIQRVRREYPDLPIILLTDDGIEGIVSDALGAGATDFVQKRAVPEQYDLLTNRIRNAVERYRSEHRLHEIREEYTTLFENAQNGLLVVDIEDDGFRYRKCNRRAVELIGRDREAIVDKHPRDALGPANEKKVVGAYRKCVDECEPVEYAITIDVPVGHVTRECKVMPLTAGDEVEQLLVEFHDVTDRVERQRELERYNRIVQNLPVGVFRTTPDGDLVSFNEQLMGIYEAESRRELAAVDVEGLYSDPSAWERLYSRLEATGTVQDERLRVETLDDEEKWVETSITLVEEDGDQYLDGIVEDVTAQVEREQELEAAETEITRLNHRNQTILSNIRETVLVTDDDGQFTYVCPNVHFIFGYDSEAVTDMGTIEALFDERLIESEMLEEDGEVTNVETTITDSGGTERTVLVTVRQVDIENGTRLYSVREITERKEREKELEEWQQSIEQALDTLDELFYVLDSDGTFRRWNAQFSEVTGYAESELDDMHAAELFPEDEQETVADSIEKVLAGERVTVEADILTDSEERKPYEFTGHQLTDADQNTIGIVGIGRDLTEIREQQRRFRALTEQSPDLISVVDAGARFQYASPSWSQLGYDPEELVGDTVWQYVHPDDRANLVEIFEAGLADPDMNPVVEFRVRRADGSWRWLEARGNNQFDNPAVEGYVVNKRDITERKESEAELQRQHDRLAAVYDAVPHVITEVEFRDGGPVVQNVNDSFHDVFGYSREQVIGKSLDELIVPEEYREEAAGINQSAQNGEAVEREVERVTADGERRTFLFRSARISREDQMHWLATYVDITERKHRERELKRKETVFENTQDAIFLVDAADESEFRIQRVNPAYCEATGLTNEDVRGKTPHEILGEQEGSRAEARYRECIERNEPIEYDETLTIDGENTVWHTTLAPVERHGTVEYLVGATRDVTEKRERIQELSELQRAVETILENVPLVLFSFDEDGIFTRSQGSGLDRLGLESGDSVGMSVFDMFGDHPEIPSYCDRALDGEQVTATVEAGDGIFEVWFQPLEDDGDVTGVVGIGYDITERKQRERELLRKSRALENAPVGVTMTDPNHDDNPIIYANDRFEEITSYSKSETAGRNCRYLQGKRTDPEPVATMREAIDKREEVSVELRNYRKDGTEFWNRVDIAPVFDEDGDLVNFVGFQQDVTERKQREQQIQVFNRILRHNLRNRLTVARAYLERVAREHRERTGESDGVPAGSAGIDGANLEPALNAVEDLIDLSEKSKELHRAMSMDAERQEIELGSYLSRLVADVRRSFPEASLSFERSEDVVLSAFPSLRVALREMLENAAKHAGPEPSISVAIEETVETVEIRISDNGQGLSEQDQRILAEGTETPLMHGSGLGLWMVSWIVTSHGGSLDADVNQDGTTVTMSLPRSSTETASVSVVSEPELQQARDRFETIFEESFDAMVITGPDGNYIEVNAAATELFGLTERKLLGSRLEEFAVDLDRPQVTAAMESGRERDQFTLLWPDGTERFVEYSVTPNIVSEQHLFVFRDVTERKHREQALAARTRELERQNDRLNEFASVVSHDLRNPLNVATKQLERVRRECDSEHIANVADAHRRIDELIGDVLDLARAGQELGDIEPVQLTAAVAQCWQTVESKDASLAIQTDCQLRADPSRFRQLVANLLRNAIEHGGDDVSITVSQREDGDGFYVADDGPGVPADELDSIFESGYSTEEEGTGFGLAIVDEIVDAHGWSIQVSESEHGGARFDITNVS